MTNDSDYLTRFGGIARLYGVDGLARLRKARVIVVGVGGVGSWTVEALARSGVGHLTLVDLDDICVTNINRQLPALDGTVGRSKIDVLAERIHSINPECHVDQRLEFFTAATANELLSIPCDGVIDAIDQVPNKCLLIAECLRRKIPLVVCGGAGGRRDPTAIRVKDLALTSHDPLLAEVRYQLRHEHQFSAESTNWGVEAVFTTELPVFPQPDGSVCGVRPKGSHGVGLRLNCDAGVGAATFVTGAVGFTAAGVMIGRLAQLSPGLA